MTNNCAINVTANFDSLSDYSLQLNRWFLKPIGAWPLASPTTKFERILSHLLIFLCYCFILSTVIPSIFHIILVDESLHLKLKLLGPLGHWFIGGINYTTLLLRSKEIRGCVEHMQTDWRIVTRPEDQQVMLKNAKIGRYVAIFCAAFMQCGVLCYCVITAFTMQTVQVGNETRTVHMLPCKAYKKIVAVDTSPTNEIVLASQFVSGFIVNSSAVGAFSLAAVFAAHAYGQLSVLMIWITEFVNHSRDQNKNVYFSEIGVVVEHHLRVLSFIARIEDVMNRICFMELFKCTLDMCMLGYYILTEWSDSDVQTMTTHFMILISMCFNIFTVCYIGEILTEQCKKVGEVVYMTNWYYLPDKDILNLLLIISRSSLVIKITAGACSLIAVFVMHVCGQFRILVTKLDKLIDGVKGRKSLSTHEQRLGDIIEHHLKILGFISQIEGLLNEICFVEVIGCTLNICFLTYYLLTEWEQNDAIGTFTYLMFLISLTFNVFILCYIGEILSEQCLKVGVSTYMIDWYRLPGKKAQGLILIFAVSNSSIKLTAGKIIDLSLSSFCSVLKTAFAYLSLLRTLTT
ncbi:PREDICTED: uncharacterized protein LOC108577311 [Habropoda laboriosa]|uniref:uncharacterized protein LOC108577311 n=1 Tax=Habropoda laboriosa TaxID=597456 RepID=UPI00083D6312|nr:PREDICTED: uncharacterized protein LOC108577311 [Habropoda laboriosa]